MGRKFRNMVALTRAGDTRLAATVHGDRSPMQPDDVGVDWKDGAFRYFRLLGEQRVAGDPTELLIDLEGRIRNQRWMESVLPLCTVSAIATLLLATKQLPFVLAFDALVLAIAWLHDRLRTEPALIFDLHNEHVIERFRAVSEVVLMLRSSRSLIHVGVGAQRAFSTHERRENGRHPDQQGKLPWPTNLWPWTLHADRHHFVFLPDAILVHHPEQSWRCRYDELSVTIEACPISYGSPFDTDAVLLTAEHLHRRKDGGADLRFSYNPLHCSYGFALLGITFGRHGPYNFLVSRADAAESAVYLLKNIVAPPLPPPPAPEPITSNADWSAVAPMSIPSASVAPAQDWSAFAPTPAQPASSGVFGSWTPPPPTAAPPPPAASQPAVTARPASPLSMPWRPLAMCLLRVARADRQYKPSERSFVHKVLRKVSDLPTMDDRALDAMLEPINTDLRVVRAALDEMKHWSLDHRRTVVEACQQLMSIDGSATLKEIDDFAIIKVALVREDFDA